MPERAVPGSPIKPNLTAEWYNSTLDKAPPPEKKRGKDQKSHNEIIAVFEPTVDNPTANRFDPVAPISRADEYGERESRICKVDISSLNQYNWIITQAKMEAGMVSQPCVYTGLTWAKVDIIDPDHKFVKLNTTTKSLESSNVGKGLILVSGAEYCLISIETYVVGLKLFRFALLEDLDSGSAAATIKDMAGTIVDVKNVLDPESIFDELVVGDTGLALYQDGIYYVIQAPCGEP